MGRGMVIGADFMSKEVIVDDAQVTVQLWDTAGQERFQSLASAYYRGADCCLLVYDVNIKSTLERLTLWRDEFLRNRFSDANSAEARDFPFVIVGNKTDFDPAERQVAVADALDWMASVGIDAEDHFETSAKDDVGVTEAFMRMSVKAHRLSSHNDGDTFAPVKLDIEYKNKGCGC